MNLENLRRVVKLMAIAYTGKEFVAARAAVLTVAYMSGGSAEEMRAFEDEIMSINAE